MGANSLIRLVLAAVVLLGSAEVAVALEVPSSPGNDSIAQAQSLDGSFSLDANPDIENSTVVAHATVLGDGDDSLDYYSFTVPPEATVPPGAVAGPHSLLDIDGAYPSFDSVLTLYDSAGAVLRVSDDRGGADLPGSVSPRDSFLVHTFTAPGTYYVRVSRYDVVSDSAPVPDAGVYKLHVSVPYHEVVDVVPPVLSLPSSVDRRAPGPTTGVPASWTATAHDGIDGAVPVTCDPTSGSTFLPGTTTVECSATDAAGNTSTGTFPVNVLYLPPPEFSGVPAPIVLDATGASGAVVTYEPPTAMDLLFQEVRVTCEPASGSVLPVGTWTVQCRATDMFGTEGTVTFPVTVRTPFRGFFAPVDNGVVMNRVKAGRAVPVKFSLGGDRGLGILADGSPGSHRVDCDSAAPVDVVEQTLSAGDAGLSYDSSTDTYTYVWKTNTAWSGTCRELTVVLDDGTSHSARFTFTR